MVEIYSILTSLGMLGFNFGYQTSSTQNPVRIAYSFDAEFSYICYLLKILFFVETVTIILYL